MHGQVPMKDFLTIRAAIIHVDMAGIQHIVLAVILLIDNFSDAITVGIK